METMAHVVDGIIPLECSSAASKHTGILLFQLLLKSYSGQFLMPQEFLIRRFSVSPSQNLSFLQHLPGSAELCTAVWKNKRNRPNLRLGRETLFRSRWYFFGGFSKKMGDTFWDMLRYSIFWQIELENILKGSMVLEYLPTLTPKVIFQIIPTGW